MMLRGIFLSEYAVFLQLVFTLFTVKAHATLSLFLVVKLQFIICGNFSFHLIVVGTTVSEIHMLDRNMYKMLAISCW